MPSAPKKPCARPGCAVLVQWPARFCAQHTGEVNAAKREYDIRRNDTPTLAEAARIRNSTQWQKVRALHKAQNPLCCDPLCLHPERPEPTAHSHHIEPLATHPHLAFDMENLAPLCTRCHPKIEAMERQGQSTQKFFAKCKT